MNITDLKPNSTVDKLDVEVISKDDPREFTTFRGSGRVSSAVIKDKTGTAKLSLWNDEIEKVNAGDKITIENGWVKEYRGELQVSAGRNGTLTVH
ncbi:Single-stranded DNA binding protein Ssb [uncultured archaeon]|nr:Single-stranded DNA binding protein Ssb [uncultured archaeon]